jgi:hypothetical protein
MDVAALSLQVAVLAVATYGLVGHVAKPGLRALARRGRRRALSRRQAAAYSWATRALALAVGAGLGLVPIWPGGDAPGAILGLVAGCLCVPIHSAVRRAVPGLVASLSGGDATGLPVDEEAP